MAPAAGVAVESGVAAAVGAGLAVGVAAGVGEALLSLAEAVDAFLLLPFAEAEAVGPGVAEGCCEPALPFEEEPVTPAS